DTVFPDGYYGRYDGESGSYEATVESLRKLDGLDVEFLLSGHGSPVLEDGNRHIDMALRSAT
ncbi:MBL fold metallo-hydrolase, partial [Candidatus Bathyarchaeota archaeon]|nr:MBL fold metallo-hydrolase [Candidatus Bathyarchaeota archaeon]